MYLGASYGGEYEVGEGDTEYDDKIGTTAWVCSKEST